MDSAVAVDDIIKSALEIIDGTVECVTAAEAQTQLLRTKVSEQERIILEKVAAAAKVTLQEDLLQETIRQLVDRSYLDQHHAEKLASQLKKDPNQALYLVQRLTNFGPAHEEGTGTKSAFERTANPDPDGWGTVMHKGAA